jgi:hypothetical protein
LVEMGKISGTLNEGLITSYRHKRHSLQVNGIWLLGWLRRYKHYANAPHCYVVCSTTIHPTLTGHVLLFDPNTFGRVLFLKLLNRAVYLVFDIAKNYTRARGLLVSTVQVYISIGF